jgi:menaquinone-dependent protoporphyrinogen IX oxidase
MDQYFIIIVMHSKQLLPSNLHDQQICMLRDLNLVSMAEIEDYQTIVICPTMPELHWHIIFSKWFVLFLLLQAWHSFLHELESALALSL